MSANLSDIANKILDLAMKSPADAADVMVISERSISIEVRDNKLEQAESSESMSAGLRVLLGKRQACISSSDMRTEALGEMVNKAVTMAENSLEDPYAGLATPDQLATDTDASKLDIYNSEDPPSPDVVESIAKEIEHGAQKVSGVSMVEGASAGHGSIEGCLLMSNGFRAVPKMNYRYMGCSAVAGSGLNMETDHYGETRIYSEDMLSPHEIGQLAGQRAVDRLGSKRPPTGNYPVLFDERVANSLIQHLLSAINGSAITRGSSWLLNSLGSKILPDIISIVEDPWRPRSLSSRIIDSEGLPTKKRVIVNDGVLQTWILDLSTGRKLGSASTANAGRTVGALPHPSVSNIDMTQGDKSVEDLFHDMGTGLYVTSMIGSMINPNTGDYSRGASGFWIVNGEKSYPVSEFTIAGNLREMLKTIIPANDAKPFRSYRVPSLLVEGITIAGQ